MGQFSESLVESREDGEKVRRGILGGNETQRMNTHSRLRIVCAESVDWRTGTGEAVLLCHATEAINALSVFVCLSFKRFIVTNGHRFKGRALAAI